MQKAVIYGTGEHLESLVLLLASSRLIQISAIILKSSASEGLNRLAEQFNIPIEESLDGAADRSVDFLIDFTNQLPRQMAMLHFGDRVSVIPSSIAWEFCQTLSASEHYIPSYKSKLHKINTILDSTHDGMIAINENLSVTLFNKSAEKMTGSKKEDVLGHPVHEVIPNSQLQRVMSDGKEEINQEQILDNGTKIITTRIPIIDDFGNKMGAFAVFKDITEMIDLAEEVTNLKSIQSMLHAIIQSSEEAISVVDEEGKGLMINPAYTKLTGLTSEKVIGKPATIDISEGESIHMQVLKTRKPVRGARLKVGPQRRDVIVNVAPIIVDGVLKGSVGVIHDVSEIKSLTEELSRARQIIRTLEAKYSFEDIKGESEEMKFAVDQARLAASTPATVLLRGESGTGKELFAHAIHNGSSRKYNKFIRVNCAAISESLLESELFGYDEGAFSGALRGGKRGLFEESNGGSIFLDEIGELAPAMQAKLLRVLQEKEIRRVGGTKSIPINVRVIAATNINLERKIGEGAFREDLYYRLNRMPIYIPPLRARKQDIRLLASHLIHKLNQDYGKNIEEITNQAEEILKQYEWPGNVRELENVLGRAMIHMGHHEQSISSSHIDLPSLDKTEEQMSRPILAEEIKPLALQMEKVERDILQDTLTSVQGNKTKCAKALGISLRSLYYKLEKYGISQDE
ncbi:sigma-54-dependent Fis family transcriptional regulator [Fictibacillus sp. KIGAM418]|uniref:Sigma-54-dependent Fis family transcriptional regulator n=1 Tax=Fictibacillus marinisediminis TaxID=2878389 RepID=A0A9X2BDG1_9BACL|nr:sigma-54-dependent Fis family transcriptional regulator [Fictibacillus marinisediminis]MCK6257636.1 sigma-54-dependent Fis family transcriptional regulator [Fictibacillus marinisediminis]